MKPVFIFPAIDADEAAARIHAASEAEQDDESDVWDEATRQFTETVGMAFLHLVGPQHADFLRHEFDTADSYEEQGGVLTELISECLRNPNE